MDKLKDPEFGLNVLRKFDDSEDIEELLKESTEFFVGNEAEIAVHKIKVQKVTNLIFFIQVVS